VARTRRFYGTAAGAITVGDEWNFHEAENRGSRTRVNRAPTEVRRAPVVKLNDSDGIGYDDLVLPFSIGLKGGITGVGGAADKTWTFTPSQTATNSYESMSMDIGDDVQNYIFDYVQATRWMLTAELGQKTHLEMDVFAQDITKGAASAPAENATPRIPADLWTIKTAATFAGLGGASVQANVLRSWSFEYLTGIKPRFYLDGTLLLGQSVETDLIGNLSMEVESVAYAVSEFYDKWQAGTLDFVRLKAQGPVLGGTFYSLQLDIPVYWSLVEPLSGVDDGVNLYKIEGKMEYDGTNGLSVVLINSLAAIP
jgi:hypothetical protein